MRSEKREARMREIEAVAYGLFAKQGFEGTSMLAVAKAARASNETLYRWYGDRNGLFESMVKANAARVKAVLAQTASDNLPASQVLDQLAPALVGMLLSEEAILLNRAAASDPTGALGRVLADAGREDVLPLIGAVLARAVAEGHLHGPGEGELGPLFVSLLVGDRQVRRVIGTLSAPDDAEVAEIAQIGLAHLRRLCGEKR